MIRPEILRARETLADYVEVTSFLQLELWQQQICQTLDGLLDHREERLAREKRGRRILMHGPPQYGKSIIVSQRFPSYALGKYPDLRIGLTCYNETHAESFGKVNLDLMRTVEYGQIFPENECRVPDRCSVRRWYTAQRMAARDAQPSFVALGIGSGFTGLGSDIFLIDDPYKNREEAYSEVIRDNILQWWKMVAKPRLAMADIVVMFHRWHLDDLAGQLMQEGGWEIITFPAIANGDPNDPTGRQVNELLSSRFTREWLEDLRSTDAAGFQALFQGNPVPEGGNLVKAHWWRYWYPAGMPEPEPIRVTLADGTVHTCVQVPLPATFDEVVQSWDLGFVGSDTADFAAGGVAGRCGPNVYIVDERHQRCDLTDAEALILGLCTAYPGGYTKLVEAKALGPRVISRLQGQIAGIFPVKPDGDKKARLQAVLPRIRSGNVYLPHPSLYPWVTEYRGELETFPVAANDDRVDWTSQLLAYCEGQDWSYLQAQDEETPATIGNTVVRRAPEPDEEEEGAFEEAFMRMMGRSR